MRFEPIAIVGRSCVFPGALDPDQFFSQVCTGTCSISGVPAQRWDLRPGLALGNATDASDRTWSDAGGYVTGFETQFDPRGFLEPAERIAELDPLFLWVLHTAREALAPVGHSGRSARAGLIMGNLSFPTRSLARYAASVWLDAQGPAFLNGRARELVGLSRPSPHNRFMSGLPALFAARALGLDAGAFALDAACASSLYAIKLACDWLHDRKADLMLAGAANGADSLFLHIGFCALSALSRSGHSRPFDRTADGLVPAEGAAFVALKRLDDALTAGDRILGVVRGVGLSNDGRARGLLVPSEAGQVRAMREAYAMAEFSAREIDLVECHATGTPVGDATELASMGQVFAGVDALTIGSVKANLGHLTTAAGMAGLHKVLSGMAAELLPPMPPVGAPLPALADAPFRLIAAPEPWPAPADRPRRAAVSAFGFGGNNAHLLVEQWNGRDRSLVAVPRAEPARAELAIVGLCALVGDDSDVLDFTAQLFSTTPSSGSRSTVALAQEGLRFPPNDLQQTLPQQLLVLEAARMATQGCNLPRERTAVWIGMGTDPEVARYGARWQVRAWAEGWESALGERNSSEWLRLSQEQFSLPLTAAAVLGTMGNVPANRINSQLDLSGPSMTVSAEELSGHAALDAAARALAHREIDVAIVGAVDMCDEAVHRTALAELGQGRTPADAAVVLVLKRLRDAQRDGDRVLAILDDEPSEPSVRLGSAPGALDLLARRGHAHAAQGLLDVAVAALTACHGVRVAPDRSVLPWLGPRTVEAATQAQLGLTRCRTLRSAGPAQPLPQTRAPRLELFVGADARAVHDALAHDRACPLESAVDAPARLVVSSFSELERADRLAQASRFLRDGGPPPDGVAYHSGPLRGELAGVFAGAAAAYRGMGGELLLSIPQLVAALELSPAALPLAADWLYGVDDTEPHPLQQLWSSSLLCQVHARLTRDVLGLRPQAVIGYSSGESNALFATGAWRDFEAMLRESGQSPIFQHEITGAFSAVARAWRKQGWDGEDGEVAWRTYALAAPLEAVREALATEPRVHLTIINSDDDCVIAGESAGCERVIARIGRQRALPIAYALAAHCPELEEVRTDWYALHRRQTFPVPDVRFYFTAGAIGPAPTADTAAEAITQQSLGVLDFPSIIRRAYDDGVRVFVEHGPRGRCSAWIKRILGDRDHLAVALDLEGRSPVRQAVSAAAWLLAAGIPVNSTALLAALGGPAADGGRLRLEVPAHRPQPRLPRPAGDRQRMPAAPPLAPVTEQSEPPTAAAEPAEAPPVALEPNAARPAAAAPDVARPLGARATVVAAAPKTLATPRVSLAAVALAAIETQQAIAGAAHREYIATQADAHERFLNLQARAVDLLLGAYPRAAPRAVRGRELVRVSAEPAPAVAHALPRPATAAPAPVPERAPRRPGPKFSRHDLIVHASGAISSIFGSAFESQDGFVRQVRMPEPPLLLADRVTGIEAEPMSMGVGRLWTETDVQADSWYLHAGRMPAGILIEAGQADLFLASWLGVDRLNRSERVYRLLGCELTYHHELPRPGQVLEYEIHIDGHAQQGDTRLFFFHYDCWCDGELALRVRNGQAGFFTDRELATSAGILWDPTTQPAGEGSVAPPPRLSTKRGFDYDALRAFSEGRAFDCFGPGFELAQAHVRTPRISAERMLLLHRVLELDPSGGPWGRGYLRAELSLSPDDWFFHGHFKNDPCMPGTLMFEGCMQTMAFYLTALGHTLQRDGWRFEPVPDRKSVMRCRGQVTPSSHTLVYELFVRALSDGPLVELQADLLCTVDGLKAFHAAGFALRLVPDWPLEEWRIAQSTQGRPGRGTPSALRENGGLHGYREPKPAAESGGFCFDYASLLACAWGRPSTAFGKFYQRFDGPRRVARLPGPPYHFVSRVTRIAGEMGALAPGAEVEVEYDIPGADHWYFADAGTGAMPLCVLMEAALQPCGWLASYAGSTLSTEIDLMFRNLDGTATVHAEIHPDAGVLKTRVKLTNVSRSAGMIIETFEVACAIDERPIYTMKTVFGFFPEAAFENQAGLPVPPNEQERVASPEDGEVDLRPLPGRYFAEQPRMAGGMLRMLDRITRYDARGGKRGLGWLRAEKAVDPAEWFFKAHFFQDPVQPGSLGIEALCQLLQFVMIEQNMMDGVERPRFEPIALERALSWKYRGQVVPHNRTITSELELIEVGEDERGRYALADAYLWVDGVRIYQVTNLGLRIVPGAPATASAAAEELLDPAIDRWIGDHRPTWTLPALPMMSMVDRLVQAAQREAAGRAVEVSNVQLTRWLVFSGGPVRLRTETRGSEVTLLAWRKAHTASLSRFEPLASGSVRLAADWPRPPAAWEPLSEAEPIAAPYESGSLFHGPAFQILRSLRCGPRGASGVLDAAADGVPPGALRQGLLDALTHAIPHDEMQRWSDEIPRDHVGYPHRIESLRLYGPLPSRGELRVEARFDGFAGERRFPIVQLQLVAESRVLAELRLVEVLLPKGPLGIAPLAARRAFLRDRQYVGGLGLSRRDGTGTELDNAAIAQSDWLPGNVAQIYAAKAGATLAAEVAIKDHVARQLQVHPSRVEVAPDLALAHTPVRPLRRFALHLSRTPKGVRVDDVRPSVLDLASVRAFWRREFGLGPGPVEGLYLALIEHFIEDLIVPDPDGFAQTRGRSVVYVANHQVGIESLLFSVIIPSLTGLVTETLAKAEHRHSWLGGLIQHAFAYPGVRDPAIIRFFQRDDQAAFLAVGQQIAAGLAGQSRSAMFHVEGTRARSCREPVKTVSAAVIEIALASSNPIVPVRFVGGLPIEPVAERLEFPTGYGRQAIWIGSPIAAEELRALPLRERRDRVLAAINGLGPGCRDESPSPPNPRLAERIARHVERFGSSLPNAVLACALETAQSDEAAAAWSALRRAREELVSDSAEAEWLATLSRQLFNPARS